MLLFLAITAMAVAGAIHFSIVPAQYQHAPAHGIFFGLVGAAQLFWSFAYWRHRTPKLAFVGLALSGGMIFLWLLTRVAAPFEQDPHAIGWAALTAKGGEFVTFISLVTIVLKRSELFGRAMSVAPVLAAALVITLSSGLVTWGGGHLTEIMYPEIGHEGDHDSSHDHGPELSDGDGHAHFDEEQGGSGNVMEGMSSDPEHEEDQGSSDELGS